MIRMKGILNSGKLSDIDFRKLNEEFSGAFVVLRNSSKLKIKEFEELDVKEGSVEVIEEKIISEVDESDLIKGLFDVLNDEKLDGEKNLDFEMRVVKNTFEVLEIDN